MPGASRERYLRNLDERLRHVHYWSAERWTHELSECGLVPDEFIGYLDGPQVRRWETLSRFTGGLAYALLRGMHERQWLSRESKEGELLGIGIYQPFATRTDGV